MIFFGKTKLTWVNAGSEQVFCVYRNRALLIHKCIGTEEDHFCTDKNWRLYFAKHEGTLQDWHINANPELDATSFLTHEYYLTRKIANLFINRQFEKYEAWWDFRWSLQKWTCHW